ncbi:MAG TPA: rod shape-determining protein MreC [Candidatus Andersenbacteria bacterium]|nr:rod shape-determining protein MreC [Candidatus Andersenbacteria bacterium]
MKKRNVIALTILLLILLIIGFSFTPIMQHVRNRMWDQIVRIVSVVFRLSNNVPSQSLQEKVAQLQLDNMRLTSELADYRRLREQLAAPAFDSMLPIYAHVITRPIDTLQSEYIINKGIAEGVGNGDAVVVNGSALVGFVSQLSLHSAVVQTVFHPSTSITVETVSKDSGAAPAQGLLTSRFQTSLSMGTIPRDATITAGQSVVTTSNGQQLPYGIVVGTIASVSKPENEAYQQAIIELPYNVDTIEAVTVLAPK